MTCAAALSCCHPPPLLLPLSRSYFHRSKDIQIPLPTSLSAANVALTNFQRAPWSSFFSLCCRSAPTASNSHGDLRRTLPLSKGTWSVAACLMFVFFAGFSPTPLWAKVIGRWRPGQEGEKFFRFFKENMLIAGCWWKQFDCRGWKWPASP